MSEAEDLERAMCFLDRIALPHCRRCGNIPTRKPCIGAFQEEAKGTLVGTSFGPRFGGHLEAQNQFQSVCETM